MGLDAGPNSRKEFDEVVKRARVIVWNGYDKFWYYYRVGNRVTTIHRVIKRLHTLFISAYFVTF